MQIGLALIPTVISVCAFSLSLYTWRERKVQDRRDLFLKFHERLIDIELQRGRRILMQKVNSVEDAAKLAREAPSDYEIVNRALAMFDIAALYIERNYIDQQLFLEEWGYTYAGTWGRAQFFIAERLARQAPNTWSAWPHFQSFGRYASQWVQQQSPASVSSTASSLAPDA